jgi:hypothetical protein
MKGASGHSAVLAPFTRNFDLVPTHAALVLAARDIASNPTLLGRAFLLDRWSGAGSRHRASRPSLALLVSTAP